MKKIKALKIALSAMMVSAFLLMPLSMNGQTGKTNFSGNWVLNADKSNFPQPPQGGQGQPGQGQGMRQGGFGGGNFAAKQEDNLLTVDRTRQDMNGQPQTVTSKYTLDGKESINSTARGDSKSVATWSADGKSLTIVTTRTFERNGQSMEMKSTEVWTLTSPTSLSVVSTMSTPNGDRQSTMVYDKK
ncbi:MAG: hypothetical protein ABSG89_08505 [Bacteroidales bacterium]